MKGKNLTSEHIKAAVNMLRQQQPKPYFAIATRDKSGKLVCGGALLRVTGECKDEDGHTYYKTVIDGTNEPLGLRIYLSEPV